MNYLLDFILCSLITLGECTAVIIIALLIQGIFYRIFKINKADELIEIQQGLLDLYEKQQKEIEELKEELITENDIGYKHAIADFYKFYVSKDKIREKIKELSNGTYDAKIILKQLLEEE